MALRELASHTGCVVLQTGEGVNDVRKGACANHVSTMASFLKVRTPPPPTGASHGGAWAGVSAVAARAGSGSTPDASSRLRCYQRLLHSRLASAQEAALRLEPPVS